jgi:GalNAc5-diNAcBac-PP-undecaprenol beta-1,3-glucosyltransferase
VSDLTILIPTYRHAALLPYSIESALGQHGVDVELLVVGDGVEDATREVMARFEGDSRVHFHNLPKGPRLGEAHRHRIVLESRGPVVAYLSDDDLLTPDYAVDMLRLLEDADFAHPVSARFDIDGRLDFFPWNYSRPEFRTLGRYRVGSIGLTGAAHTLSAYRRLPHGWRTTPQGMPTDHWMWRQFLELPGLRAAFGTRLTYLTFPEPLWGAVPDPERASMLADWLRRSREPGFAEQLEELLVDAIRRAAEDYHLWARTEQEAVEAFRTTRTWRLRGRVLSLLPVRAVLSRRV